MKEQGGGRHLWVEWVAESRGWRETLAQNPKGLGIQGSCSDARKKTNPKGGRAVHGFPKTAQIWARTGFGGRGAGNPHPGGWQSGWALGPEAQTVGGRSELV